MAADPLLTIEEGDIGGVPEGAAITGAPSLDLNKLPEGVVSGTTLLDFSGTEDATVRSSVSLAMLFASRVATTGMKPGGNENDWLALYQQKLTELGFRVSGSALVTSTFQKTGVSVHEALIPFLTVAFGGATVGPIILAGLRNLQAIDAKQPWIVLFDRQTRRFGASEMHFAAVSSTATETVVRYVVARLNLRTGTTRILFFRIEKANAVFKSSTISMTADNGLLARVEPKLREKLEQIVTLTIAQADIG